MFDDSELKQSIRDTEILLFCSTLAISMPSVYLPKSVCTKAGFFTRRIFRAHACAAWFLLTPHLRWLLFSLRKSEFEKFQLFLLLKKFASRERICLMENRLKKKHLAPFLQQSERRRRKFCPGCSSLAGLLRPPKATCCTSVLAANWLKRHMTLDQNAENLLTSNN